jgi:integrase
MLQYILLTATRRNEAAQIRREELVGTDWLIPGSRHKSKRDFLLPLSSAATAILDRVPFLGQQRDRGFVFTTDGTHPLSGFSKFKRRFDRACGVTGWTIHDLRRTARSLMSRAGVAPDHAERTLGHVIPGIRGTYDLHEFQDEKRQALEALALQIGRILGPKDNVVTLRSLNA